MVTPSQELEEYPELELDEAGFELDESDEDTSGELDEDAPLQLSQAEQDLANSLATGNELDQLDDDFDDEILLDNELQKMMFLILRTTYRINHRVKAQQS